MAIEINPFIVAGRIPEPYFCDRVAESKRLIRCIMNQENVVLISPRRVGKTEIVNHCFDNEKIAEHLITISIDILHTTSFSEFVMELGSAVYNRIARRSDKLFKLFVASMKTLHGSFGYDPINNTPTFAIKLGDIIQPDYSIEEIFNYIEQADKRCVIMIDEFQQITKYANENVEAILRSHIQKSSNANFIFAGSQRRIMNEMFLANNRPFYQSSTLIPLAPITLDVYTDFVIRHFNKADKNITQEAIEKVYHTFDGITFYIQRIMHDAFAETPSKGIVDVSVTDALTERFLLESSTRLREQLAYVTEQQKELLYAICEEGSVGHITSGSFIRQHHLKSASAVQSAIKRLLEYDLVTENERQYSIADPLLRIWIKHNL